MVWPDFSHPDVWLSLLTLTFLEIVLGVDNIIFISITSAKLPKEHQKRATNIGLILAMALRIILLFGIAVLIALQEPFWHFENSLFKVAVSGQSLILIAGGIFLIYKSVTEIHHKLEGGDVGLHIEDGQKKVSLSDAIIQISLINLVFSIDSILTAVGMTNGVQGALVIMILAVVISVLIMVLFAVPVGRFVNDHPTVQMLGMSFLLLIGFMLILEGAHLAHIEIAHSQVGAIPKGYLYFAIAFSLFVEWLNLRLRKKEKPIQLHGITEKAKEDGLFDRTKS